MTPTLCMGEVRLLPCDAALKYSSWGLASPPKCPAPACGVCACTRHWHEGAGLPRGRLGAEISPGQEAAGAVLVQSVVQILLGSPAGQGIALGAPQWGGDSGDIPRAWCAVWVRRDRGVLEDAGGRDGLQGHLRVLSITTDGQFWMREIYRLGKAAPSTSRLLWRALS